MEGRGTTEKVGGQFSVSTMNIHYSAFSQLAKSAELIQLRG